MTITLRLAAAEQAELDRVAGIWGVGRSEALRRLLLDGAGRVRSEKALSFADRMRDVCGIMNSGRGDLSMRVKEDWGRYVEEKHGARRRPR